MGAMFLKLPNILGVTFLKLLNMSIAASWLILAVILFRQILRKAPKWLPCALWAIVALRLVCPFALESSFSLIPSTETVPIQNIYSENSAIADTSHYYHIQSGIPQLDQALSPVLTETKSDSVLRSNIGLLAAIWMAGMLLIFLHAMVNYLRIHAMVREAVPFKGNVWLCDTVKSPFILGIVKPRIYLPSDMDGEQVDYVLAHEHAHIKRKDHWWKPFGYLLFTVYWFNPFVWAAYLLLCRDIELACDEKVIKHMDDKGKRTYSEALVSCSTQRRMIMACPLAFGEVGVKERVKTVLGYKRPAFWLIMAAVVVCVAVAVCFLTNPPRDTFNIKVVIPAGSEEQIYYSGEDIAPVRNKVTLLAGAGLVDTTVVLKPIYYETQENTSNEFVYLTYGSPVKINEEKDTWFKVGVVMGNPTEEDIVVSVPLKGVEVRIADTAVGDSALDSALPVLSGAQGDGNITGAVDGAGGTGDEVGKPTNAVEKSVDEIEKSKDDLEKLKDEAEQSEEKAKKSEEEAKGSEEGESKKYDEENTISFRGIIVENLMDTTEPIILVRPLGDEFAYEYVAFVLPEEKADWVNHIGSLVAITCTDSFQMSQPPFGELISIGGIGTLPAQLVQTDEESAISAAILWRNADSYPDSFDFACCDFVILDTLSATSKVGDTSHAITYYGWALYEKYNISAQGIETVGGSHLPIALTFELDEGRYYLKSYWEPGFGSYFVSDVREKFPSSIAEDGIDSQKFILQQKQSCYGQAIQYSHLDTSAVIGNLLETICSEPGESSNPCDYVDAHVNEYHELMYYGEYTLRYCVERFEKGEGTGLDGKIMAFICEELLQTKGKLPVDAGTAETGQGWYDTLRAHAGNLVEPYLE